MTQDQFRPRADEDELPLEESGLTAAEYEGSDEYSGLELIEQEPEKKARSRVPLLLGAVGLALVAGGYFSYEAMMNGGDASFNDAMPPMAESGAPPAAVPPQPVPVVSATPTATDPATPQIVPIDGVASVDPTTGAVVPPAAEALPPAVDTALANAPDPNAAVPPVVPASPSDSTGNAPPGDTSAMPVPLTPPPAATEPAVETPVAAVTDPAPTAPTEVTVAPVVPSAAPAVVAATPDATVSVPVATPPAGQLKPIDQNAVLQRAANLPLPDAKQKKAAETISEVNAILGSNTTNAPAAAQATMAQQVEVTPRAAQVIIVTKNYSAQSPQAMVAAGDRTLDAKQYGAAVDIFNRQLTKNPSDPLALSGKALAQQRAGETAAAMDTYQRLLDLNPRDVEALTNYLGLVQKQNPQEALTRLNALAQQHPENAAVAGQLGMVNAKMLDTPNALRNFQKAASLDPANATYAFNQAVLYDRLGSYQKAHDAYVQALSLARAGGGDVPEETIRDRLRQLKY